MHVTGNRTELGKQGLQMRVLGDGEMEFVELLRAGLLSIEHVGGHHLPAELLRTGLLSIEHVGGHHLPALTLGSCILGGHNLPSLMLDCCIQAEDHLHQVLLLPPQMFGHHVHDYRLMLRLLFRLLLREHRDCGHGC